jgi:hypothetical protein
MANRCTWIDSEFDNILEPPFWAHETDKMSPEPNVCMFHYPEFQLWKHRSDAAKRAVLTKRAKYKRWPANYKDTK